MGISSIFLRRRPTETVLPAAKFDVSLEGHLTTSRGDLALNLARRLAPHLRGLEIGSKFCPQLEKRLVSVIERTEKRALSRFKADVASELSKILGEVHPLLKAFKHEDFHLFQDVVIFLANGRNHHVDSKRKSELDVEQSQKLAIMIHEFSPKNHRSDGSDGGGEFWKKYQGRLAESTKETKAANLLLRILRENPKAIVPILLTETVRESNL